MKRRLSERPASRSRRTQGSYKSNHRLRAGRLPGDSRVWKPGGIRWICFRGIPRTSDLLDSRRAGSLNRPDHHGARTACYVAAVRANLPSFVSLRFGSGATCPTATATSAFALP
jgi:hypothetical protein